MKRRRLLQHATSATIMASTSSLSTKFLQAAAEGPNSKIRIGMIGTHGRAGFLMRTFASQKDVEMVGLADIDTRKHIAAVEVVKSITNHAPYITSDYRHLIDDNSIDAIVVGTPDHWHAIPTIQACKAGKDVYVEKPDGHNMLEGQRMVQAGAKYNRIIQMGTQSRTSSHFQKAMQWISRGELGTVLVAKAWESAKQSNIGKPVDSQPPAGVDYDMWLGAAPTRPFNVRRFHGNWRWFLDYGSGDLGNDGVHRIDVAKWALDTAGRAQGMPPLYMPNKISALGGKWYFDDLQEWPDTLQATYQFDGSDMTPGRLLSYEMKIWTPYQYNGETEGVVLYGDKGYMILGNRRWRAYDAANNIIAQDSGENDGVSHIRNFLDCMRSRKKPNADLATVGHPSSVLCHAANVSWRLGRQVNLDIKTELFIDDVQANTLRSRPEYREPWVLPEV
ncbi:MAG: Gfo/Idh/MocA family oxidoreductase [Planctomycetaceae bacterium]|jgi:predicted dehydrogenase|nr:Gfo/Idh/MocA family oxidoreductase [Planctomycetaceae bacterium]